MQAQTVNAALAEARKLYRQNVKAGKSPARAARLALEKSSELLPEFHGVESLSYSNGTLLYLNAGDPYDYTILVYLSVYNTVRFTAGNWGDLAETGKVW